MLITTHNLTKKYGHKMAVNGLDIKIPAGSLVAYLGTNGAGKSTTIKMLTGLIKPTAGVISYTNNLKIGIVFQDSVLDDELTVKENLTSRAQMYRHVDQAWVDELIQLTGLTNFLTQRYRTLSGGQKRRVDIARALLARPNLLFLDEPTTGLDIQTRQAIWTLLRKLQHEQGLTIFLTTHYLEEAAAAELIYVLENGNILAHGSATELCHQYAKSHLKLYFKDQTTPASGTLIASQTYEWEGLTSKQALQVVNSLQAHLNDFEYQRGSLDDAFINITGKELQ